MRTLALHTKWMRVTQGISIVDLAFCSQSKAVKQQFEEAAITFSIPVWSSKLMNPLDTSRRVLKGTTEVVQLQSPILPVL